MHTTDFRPHITVVGDLILDRYLIGDATKLNPEQPGVVIRVNKEEDRLGGAAAVAMIAAGFGVRVTLAGVVGKDDAGDRLRRLIDAHNIEPHLWIDDRPTTWKQRIVARGQLRPDRCDREVTTPIGDHAARFLSAVPLNDMVLISDYGKGVCKRSLLRELGERARVTGIPILVDPARGRNWSDYGQVTLIKANSEEAMGAAAENKRPLAMARGLVDEYHCNVVVTYGGHGMVAAEREGGTWYLPAEPTNVRDVCGAGDTVMAAFGAAMRDGNCLRRACRFALDAARQQITNVGIAVVAVDDARSRKTEKEGHC
jgi:D-beta-D-heptose 7-phosphate kinase/D-beta-D-heptose 1-phosphate adenosyltransferase